MVGLTGLPALRSGYTKVQPAPPQAELFRFAYKARRVQTGSRSSPFPHSTCREIKKPSSGENGFLMVGLAGFEPTASSSRTK
jgi:hypothetical protein